MINMKLGADFIESAAEELGVEPQEYIELAEEFLQDVGERLKNLSEALRENSVDATAAIAHTIKGGASQMLLEDIAEPAAALEKAAKEGDLSHAQSALEQMRVGLDEFQTHLKTAAIR
jgi:HPt (histidine-containing phosphotransfer) domain-containing protein